MNGLGGWGNLQLSGVLVDRRTVHVPDASNIPYFIILSSDSISGSARQNNPATYNFEVILLSGVCRIYETDVNYL